MRAYAMDRLARLAALIALAALLFGGCAKDTVSAPSGNSQPSALGGGTGEAAPGESALPSETPSGDVALPSSQGEQAATNADENAEGDAALPPSGDDVLLRLRLNEGDSYSFEVRQEASGMGLEAKMLISVAMNVLSVQKDATRIELRVANAKLIEGNEAAQKGMKPMLDRIKGQSVQVDVDSRGRITNRSSLPPGTVLGDMLQGGLFRFTLPGERVKVGATWVNSINVSGVPGASRPIEHTYKVTGIERQSDRTIVVIESNASQTTTGADGDNNVRISMITRGTLRVDARSGLIDSATSNTETTIRLVGRTEVMKMAVRVTRR